MIEVKIDTKKLTVEVYQDGRLYSRVEGGPEDGPMVVLVDQDETMNGRSVDDTDYGEYIDSAHGR